MIKYIVKQHAISLAKSAIKGLLIYVLLVVIIHIGILFQYSSSGIGSEVYHNLGDLLLEHPELKSKVGKYFADGEISPLEIEEITKELM